MKYKKWLLLSLVMVTAAAFSQNGRPLATDAAVDPPRSMSSVVPKPTGGIDSVMIGGAGHTLPGSSVTLPTQCALNNTLKGCDGYCAANPNAAECLPPSPPAPPAPAPAPEPEISVPLQPGEQLYTDMPYDFCGEPVMGCKATYNSIGRFAGYVCNANRVSSAQIVQRCR